MVKKITLVTPGHVSSNPRLLKEALTFQSAGFSVQIIYTRYLPFLSDMDDRFFIQYPEIGSSYLEWSGATFSSRIRKGISSIIHRAATFFGKISHSVFWAQSILNRHQAWQTTAIRKTLPDLIISHNLGALPPAGQAKGKTGALLAFDAEDYHRGEPIAQSNDGWIIKSIEDKWIPECELTWCASPLIGEKYRTLFPQKQFTPVLNVFSSRYIVNKTESEKSQEPREFKLFWFSQTIGKDRGLEDIFYAMKKLEPRPVSLTLIGLLSRTDKNYFTTITNQIGLPPGSVKYLPQIQEDQLFSMGKLHDFGLALERRHPENRNVCLTNKIFTYLSCGLAIVYSSTDAQTEFWNENQKTGILYKEGNIDQLAGQLGRLMDNPIELDVMKKNSLELAVGKYNWERESEILLNLIGNARIK